MTVLNSSARAALPEAFSPSAKDTALPPEFSALRQKIAQIGDQELIALLTQLEKSWKNERENECRLRVGLHRLLFPKEAWNDFNPDDYVPLEIEALLKEVGDAPPP